MAQTMSKESIKKALLIFLGVLSFYTIIRFGIIDQLPPGIIPNDYKNVYRSAERYFSKIEIYQVDDDSPYKYSPTFLLAYTFTYGLTEKHVSWFLWCITSILVFVSALNALWSAYLKAHAKPVNKIHFFTALGFALLAGWRGYIEHFSYGQFDLVVFGGMILAILKIKNDYASAFVSSFIILTKPHAAVLLAYYPLTGNFRQIGRILILAFLLFFAPIAVYGGDFFMQLLHGWKAVIARQSEELLSGNLNQNIAAAVSRLFHLQASIRELISGMLVVGMFVGAVVLTRSFSVNYKKGMKPVWLLCFLMALYLCVSPLSWRWVTAFWIMIVFPGVLHAISYQRKPLKIIFGFFFLLVLILQKNIAKVFGIDEIDVVSQWGGYALGNIILCGIYMKLLMEKSGTENES